jgi:hypothetical protein
MELFVNDDTLYIRVGNKTLRLTSKNSLDKLNNGTYKEKLNEISEKYLNVVSSEIENMGLEDEEKILAEIIVIMKLNDAIFHVLEELCKDLGEKNELKSTENDKRQKIAI